jgi:hypothetical protein
MLPGVNGTGAAEASVVDSARATESPVTNPSFLLAPISMRQSIFFIF